MGTLQSNAESQSNHRGSVLPIQDHESRSCFIHTTGNCFQNVGLPSSQWTYKLCS